MKREVDGVEKTLSFKGSRGREAMRVLEERKNRDSYLMN
jgi:hypothetical protein